MSFEEAPGFFVFVSAEPVAKLGRDNVEAFVVRTISARGHAKRFHQRRQLAAKESRFL